MNVRLVIDRVVVEGMTLSASERVMFEDALRESLTQALGERAASQVIPEARAAWRERMQLVLPGASKGAVLGESLGTSLADHVWTGPIPQSAGIGGNR